MSAGLLEHDRMFFRGAVPWHGSGDFIPDEEALDAEAALKRIQADFEVERQLLYTTDNKQTDHFATVRTDINKVLGVVGPRYRVLQNRDSAAWFKPWLDSGEVVLHTGGTLWDGAKIWFLAQINRPNSVIVEGDEITKFLMLSNSHDGSSAIRVGFTPVRIVCANTLAMAHNDKCSRLLRIKHTGDTVMALEKIREIINLAEESFEMTAEQYRFLAAHKVVNSADLRNFIKIVLGVEKKKDEDLSTRIENQIKDIEIRYLRGMGQTSVDVAGSWWAAYNGYTEWLNYKQGNNQNNRLDSLWFGANFADNESALETAMSFAEKSPRK